MRKWDENLWLFTPDEIDQLPKDTKLKSINAHFGVSQEVDRDIRFGHTAWGMTDEMIQTHPMSQTFLLWILNS